MSIHADLEKLKTGVRDLRKFGLTVGGVFGALSDTRKLSVCVVWPPGPLAVMVIVSWPSLEEAL